MKKSLLLIIVFCFVLFSVFAAVRRVESASLRVSHLVNDSYFMPRLLIDAGHGGEDGGAVAADGTIEKHLNLAIAQQIKHMAVLFGADYQMIRQSDDALSDLSLSTIRERKMSDLKKRLDIVNACDDALLISIHQNQFADRSCKGLQVFYSANHPFSMQLADVVQDHVQVMLQQSNKRTTKVVRDAIYLLHHARIPAIMIECGFMSNPDELACLKDPVYGSKLVLCIFSGLIDCCMQQF